MQNRYLIYTFVKLKKKVKFKLSLFICYKYVSLSLLCQIIYSPKIHGWKFKAIFYKQKIDRVILAYELWICMVILKLFFVNQVLDIIIF